MYGVLEAYIQRELVFFFPCYHILSPTYLSRGRFYVFFSLGMEKKNRPQNSTSDFLPNLKKKSSTNLDLLPKIEQKMGKF